MGDTRSSGRLPASGQETVPPTRKRKKKKTCDEYERQTKRRGELSELAFLHKAASLGFKVSKPYGDSERYDFALDAGHRFWRIQGCLKPDA
jgi:hypothetical protein